MVSFPLYCLSPRDCLLRRHEYMFSSPLYPFRRAIVCFTPRIHVLDSSLSLSPRDCLFHATNTCSRLPFIPFPARFSFFSRDYMSSSPFYPFRLAISLFLSPKTFT